MTNRWIPTPTLTVMQLDEEARTSATQRVADPSPEHRPSSPAREDNDAEIENIRQIGSVITWLFFAWCLYRTINAPMAAVVEPLLLTIAVGIGAFYVWPRQRKIDELTEDARESGTDPAPTRRKGRQSVPHGSSPSHCRHW